MKQSALAAKQQAVRQAYFQAAERVTQQLMLDTIQLTLHQEFGFGYDRIKKMTDAWGAYYNTYHDALDGGPEADYWQERLDRALLEMMKGRQELIPFRERYPEIREITYGKRK